MLSNSINLDMSAHGHGSSVLEDTVKVAIDINRHKELIIKSSSAILITLLKFFRLNHVYQFENFSQYLVLANCLPLVLKFLDQNICRYFQSKHELCPFNYPKYPLYYVRNGYESPVLNVDNVDEGVDTESPSYYLWRNVFSSINLLRVVNKLTKWKHARTMMLVVFKSAPVFKRCMRAKLGIFQLYVLKLLKMQARYLGRQWRKSNMDIISSIYLKVRHRLNDDWAFANETRSKSFDFQVEEGELGLAVKKFNSRRYHHILDQSGENATSNGGPFTGKSPIDDMDMRDFEPVDNSLQSVLSWQPNFSDRFKRNYSKWVDEEVIKAQIDWDALLVNSKGIAGDCY
ncbi:striatin-interacting protein 1 [Ditylenchus destructor]|uniref:Striatin-interacting protein 1 n=1 Tax=Ditylenchus destructor TaxID=166010 RepID=A0AAD4N1I9_9BILA|nr:striatin-interacting protein 1 [Ditylenchus destructor]